MKSKELVKHIMTQKEVTNAEMAKVLNISQAALWDRLNPKKTNNMTVRVLSTMLSTMGCELIIRDINSGTEYQIEE